MSGILLSSRKLLILHVKNLSNNRIVLYNPVDGKKITSKHHCKNINYERATLQIILPLPIVQLHGSALAYSSLCTNQRGLWRAERRRETFTFRYDEYKPDRAYSFGRGVPKTVQKVIFEASFKDYRPTSTAKLFNNCNVLKEIDGIEYLNTEQVTDMGGMFYYCSGLTSLDLSHFNIQNVTDMGAMFSGCWRLTSLDVSHFNTQNVTDMYGMFFRCSGLTSLDLSHFKTQKVTDMREMFKGCGALATIKAIRLGGARNRKKCLPAARSWRAQCLTTKTRLMLQWPTRKRAIHSLKWRRCGSLCGTKRGQDDAHLYYDDQRAPAPAQHGALKRLRWTSLKTLTFRGQEPS